MSNKQKFQKYFEYDLDTKTRNPYIMRTLAACSKEVLHHGSGEKEFWSNFLSKASL